MRVVVNTSPLIALDRIGQITVLRDLFGAVVRPQSVLDELLAGSPVYGMSDELRDAPWITTEADPEDIILRHELGAGETAAIALAYRTRADLVVLDDLRARLTAEALGLPITGTLGVLSASHAKGLLPDLRGSITRLAAVGFRLPQGAIERMGL